MKEQLAAAIKEFCEDALATGDTQFSYVALVDYAMARTPGANQVQVGEVVGELFTRGEINTVCISHEQGIYQVVPPAQAQTTMFGAASGGGEAKAKKAPFTKKQKKAALEALNPIIEVLPQYPEQYQTQHGENLKRLQQWLQEQVG